VILAKEQKDWSKAAVNVMKGHRVWSREEARKVPV